jgi:hypothetical protein
MAAAPINARMFQTFIATALAAGHIGLTLKFQKPDAPDSRESGKGRGRVKKRTVPISGIQMDPAASASQSSLHGQRVNAAQCHS